MGSLGKAVEAWHEDKAPKLSACASGVQQRGDRELSHHRV